MYVVYVCMYVVYVLVRVEVYSSVKQTDHFGGVMTTNTKTP